MITSSACAPGDYDYDFKSNKFKTNKPLSISIIFYNVTIWLKASITLNMVFDLCPLHLKIVHGKCYLYLLTAPKNVQNRPNVNLFN